MNEVYVHCKLGEAVENTGKELKRYVDEGIPIMEREESAPVYIEHIDTSKFKPLERVPFDGRFLSVDCSSVPLHTGINWQVRAIRAVYVIIARVPKGWEITEEGTPVDTVGVANASSGWRRRHHFENISREIESELAVYALDKLDAGDFCIMDGAALFGGQRRFSTNLYEESRKRGLNLLMFTKISRVLRDDRGKDLPSQLAYTADGLGYSTWVYHPVRKADKHANLYGDISCVKLSLGSRVFRCDIPDFIVEDKTFTASSLSKLVSVSQDPRCIGYPSPPFCAHQASQIPKARLAELEDLTRKHYAEKGIWPYLSLELAQASFRREALQGRMHDYEVRDEEGWM